jgi:hypothetical protein
VPVVDGFDVVFGARYVAGAIAADAGAGAPPFEPVRELSGRPGTRAPHLWLERDGRRLSTLDLFGRDVVLLTGRDGSAWTDAARTLTTGGPLAIDCQTIGAGTLRDPEGQWSARYGIGEDGASLIRPDGIVAWRAPTRSDDPAGELGAALSRLGLVVNASGRVHSMR